jgi:hypothetical protein
LGISAEDVFYAGDGNDTLKGEAGNPSGAVKETMQPAHVTLWLYPDRE